jgi:TPR repeat protein
MQDNDMSLPRPAHSFVFASAAKSAYGSVCARAAYWVTAAALVAGSSIAWGISSIATATEPAADAGDSELRDFEQGCQLGDGMQCNDLGVSYLHGYGVAVDVPVAQCFSLATSET